MQRSRRSLPRAAPQSTAGGSAGDFSVCGKTGQRGADLCGTSMTSASMRVALDSRCANSVIVRRTCASCHSTCVPTNSTDDRSRPPPGHRPPLWKTAAEPHGHMGVSLTATRRGRDLALQKHDLDLGLHAELQHARHQCVGRLLRERHLSLTPPEHLHAPMRAVRGGAKRGLVARGRVGLVRRARAPDADLSTRGTG